MQLHAINLKGVMITILVKLAGVESAGKQTFTSVYVCEAISRRVPGDQDGLNVWHDLLVE